ncbi:helix-turn-helix domain-containing protein [Paenibacillus sp. NEAU-GSW1]|uniref:PAS domain S-box protein n=1 Tax=Paenibacillus sp. NEAU-GSW1 TaxID=2682486 RepID=UPI0015660879|nr:helix-turn-helix domain-containing protein [Paenibacillus sp. NEAU-GSW1]
MTLYQHIFSLLDQPMAVIRVIRDSATILEANQAFSQLTGYTTEHLRGRPVNGIIEQYSANSASRNYIRETFLHTKRKRRKPIQIEHKAIQSDCGEEGTLALALIEDLSAKRWIEEQYERNKVLISGIVDSTFHIRFLRDFYAPMLFVPDQRLEDENFLQFISETEYKRINEALEASGKFKKMNDIKVRTSKLSGVELEVTLTFMPIFDGFGKIKEYAFVIWDLLPVNDTIDSAMRLKIWMAKRDMSANQLSAATHISLQTISKLRNGKIAMPQRLTAELIASELKVEVSEIWPEVRKGR